MAQIEPGTSEPSVAMRSAMVSASGGAIPCAAAMGADRQAATAIGAAIARRRALRGRGKRSFETALNKEGLHACK
ncbi:hypothetical protein GCM10023209_32240 [Roseibacterium beibuensis]|uniref:Uncharacterized protein n=1 Tax=[Roseibacterium] beibuensis TaxID=1193142 RepID=A0ABP9LJP5_9RHOB